MNTVLIAIVLFLLIVEIIFLVFYFRHRNKDRKNINNVHDWMSKHKDKHKMSDGDYQKILLSLHKDMHTNKKRSEQNLDKIGVLQDVATDNRLMAKVNEENIKKEKSIAFKNHSANRNRIDQNRFLITENEASIDKNLQSINNNTMLITENEVAIDNNLQSINNNSMLLTEHEEAIRNNLERIKFNDLLITNNEDSMLTGFDQISARTAAAIARNTKKIEQNSHDISTLRDELNKVKQDLANGVYSPDVEDITHRTMTLLDLAEFKGLDPEVKRAYKATIVDKFMPHVIVYLNRFLADIEVISFLQEHAVDLAKIFEKVVKVSSFMNDSMYENWLSTKTVSAVATNPDYMIGLFIPMILERLYKETVGLKNYPDKDIPISPDVIMVPDSSDRPVAKILGKRVELHNVYNFETHTVVNQLDKNELEEVLDKETRDELLKMYMETLYRNVERIGGFQQEIIFETEPTIQPKQPEQPVPSTPSAPVVYNDTIDKFTTYQWPENELATQFPFTTSNKNTYLTDNGGNITIFSDVHLDTLVYLEKTKLHAYNMKTNKKIITINLDLKNDDNPHHVAFNGTHVAVTHPYSKKDKLLNIYNINTNGTAIAKDILLPRTSAAYKLNPISISYNWIGFVHDKTIYIHSLSNIQSVANYEDFEFKIQLPTNKYVITAMSNREFVFNSKDDTELLIPLTTDPSFRQPAISILIYKFDQTKWIKTHTIGSDMFEAKWKLPRNVRFHGKNIMLSGYNHGSKLNGETHTIKDKTYQGTRGAVEVLRDNGSGFVSNGFHYHNGLEYNDNQNGTQASIYDKYIMSMSYSTRLNNGQSGDGEITVYEFNENSNKWNLTTPYFKYRHTGKGRTSSYPHMLSDGTIIFHDNNFQFHKLKPIDANEPIVPAKVDVSNADFR